MLMLTLQLKENYFSDADWKLLQDLFHDGPKQVWITIMVRQLVIHVFFFVFVFKNRKETKA